MDGPARPQLERTLPWVGRNLLLLGAYLLLASLVSAAFTDLIEGEFGDSKPGIDWEAMGVFFLIYVFYGGIGCLPGLAIWLTILARIPAGWTAFERRLLAVVTAPLVGLFWFIFWLMASDEEGFALVFGLLWPIGAGFVVRLRRPAYVASGSGG